MLRSTPLQRGPKKNRRSKLWPDQPPEITRRAYLQREYTRVRREYLQTHPWCQITIARLGLDEAHVIALGVNVLEDVGWVWCQGARIHRATEIHHRNKRNGERLTDVRWFMSACHDAHQWVENNLREARAVGFSLPINASPDGVWGDGNRGLETHQFMQSQVTRRDY